MRFLPSFISVLFLLPAALYAEGSCTWTDLAPLMSQTPEIRDHLTSTLDIEPSGIANRLGAQFEGLTGSRVAPYRFRARPKGDTGPYQFELVIHADLALFSAEGKRLEDDDFANAATYREMFTNVALEKLQMETPPVAEVSPTNPPSNPPTSTSEPVPEPVKEDPRVVAIREKFNEINLDDHAVYAIPFVNDNLPMEAKVVYHRDRDTGEVQYITIDGSMGDHSGISESFYFEDEKLIFVFQLNSHWTFHPQDPKQTIDSMEEKRYYFDDGVVFSANVKKYEGGGPAKLAEAAKKADIQPLELESREGVKLVSRASRLLLAREASEVSLIYELAFSE